MSNRWRAACNSGGSLASASEGNTVESTSSAASRYFSIRIADVNSASPLVSKPSPPAPSAGKLSAGFRSTPSRSRTLLLYSERFSRRLMT